MNSKKKFETFVIFADGACSGNPGPGGWGYVLICDNHWVEELYGHKGLTTNNQMELEAIIRALRRVLELSPPQPKKIRVYSDSTYVLSGIQKWIHGWKKRHWTTATGDPVKNREFWEALDKICVPLKNQLEWGWIKGHSGSPGNERVDELAVAGSQQVSLEIYEGALDEYSVELLPLPPLANPPEASENSKSTPAETGYPVYLSFCNGTLQRHTQWTDCERRVKGVPGAKFKKVKTSQEEQAFLKSVGAK